MSLEYISASFLYSFLKDAWQKCCGRKKLNPEELLNIRNKWRTEIEERLWDFRRKGLAKDVIIHDIVRQDHYPNGPDKKKGISAWFRVGLMDTYERGILLGIDWADLIQDPETGKWRKTINNEPGEKFCLAGKVPYENIVSINWDGDDYYNKPHIYCWFNRAKKQPYEGIVYCRSVEITHVPNMPPYQHYSEVVPANKIK